MGTVAQKLSAIFFAVFLSAALVGGVAFFPDGEPGTDDDAVTVSYTENGVVVAVQPIGAAPFPTQSVLTGTAARDGWTLSKSAPERSIRFPYVISPRREGWRSAGGIGAPSAP